MAARTLVASQLVPITDVARILNVNKWTVYAYVRDGHLPVVRLPGVKPGKTSRKLLFKLADVEALISRSTETCRP